MDFPLMGLNTEISKQSGYLGTYLGIIRARQTTPVNEIEIFINDGHNFFKDISVGTTEDDIFVGMQILNVHL